MIWSGVERGWGHKRYELIEFCVQREFLFAMEHLHADVEALLTEDLPIFRSAFLDDNDFVRR